MLADRGCRTDEWLQKTIPLETPTRIELSPNNEIQVTLFDANHCTGAVMFRKFHFQSLAYCLLT
jgi:hypothetical protein